MPVTVHCSRCDSFFPDHESFSKHFQRGYCKISRPQPRVSGLSLIRFPPIVAIASATAYHFRPDAVPLAGRWLAAGALYLVALRAGVKFLRPAAKAAFCGLIVGGAWLGLRKLGFPVPGVKELRWLVREMGLEGLLDGFLYELRRV